MSTSPSHADAPLDAVRDREGARSRASDFLALTKPRLNFLVASDFDRALARARAGGQAGPLFARHDKGAGKKVKPVTPITGRRIVRERVAQLLGREKVGTITPHSFRHYFVTSVLCGTGHLRYAQELARHKNIAVTERYTHLTNDELDKTFYEVFEKKSK